MRISDEIREWCNLPQAYSIPCDELRELADRIDAEMIELPKDKDGVPIHEGDKMYLDDGQMFVVSCIKFVDNDNPFFYLTDVNRAAYIPTELTHTRPDSLERIADELKTCGETKRNAGYPDVDGRERYEVRGIQAEDIIAEVMRNAAACGLGMAACWDVGNATKYLLRLGRKDDKESELGKAENYLHHALTGEWIGEGNDED